MGRISVTLGGALAGWIYKALSLPPRLGLLSRSSPRLAFFLRPPSHAWIEGGTVTGWAH